MKKITSVQNPARIFHCHQRRPYITLLDLTLLEPCLSWTLPLISFPFIQPLFSATFFSHSGLTTFALGSVLAWNTFLFCFSLSWLPSISFIPPPPPSPFFFKLNALLYVGLNQSHLQRETHSHHHRQSIPIQLSLYVHHASSLSCILTTLSSLGFSISC